MSEEKTQNQAAAGSNGKAPRREMAIQKIYLKDASFEAPSTPEIFRGKWQPSINVDLDSRATPVDETVYEVILRLTITAKQEDKTAFLVEITQAGLFSIKGAEKSELGPILGSYCPATLFPFARQVVNEMVTQGGFPQLLLSPVNFDALYAEQVRRRQQESSGEAGDRPAPEQ